MPPENAKPVKDEVETDDEKPISQVRDKTKKKPSTPTTISKQHSKVKKEEPQESGSNLKKPSKPTPKQAKPKKEEEPKHDDKKNVKRKREEEKGNADVKKRERKVYDLPGQKRDPPEERDPLRIFYQTLHEQKPTSEMATVWMMESGLLPLEEAKRVYERKMSIKNRKLASPTKPMRVKETKSVTVKKKVEPSTPKTSNKKTTTTTKTTTVSKQTKKAKAEDPSSDEDSGDEDSGEEFVVSTKKVVKKVKAN